MVAVHRKTRTIPATPKPPRVLEFRVLREISGFRGAAERTMVGVFGV